MVWSCEAKALEVARASRSRRHEPEERASLMGERLSRYIAEIERELGTQDRATQRLGISKATFQQYRHNQGNPTLKSLALMAGCMGVKIHDVLGFTSTEFATAFNRSGLVYEPAGDQNLGVLFAAALTRMESVHGGQLATSRQGGMAHGAYARYRHDRGNPTFKTIEWAAENFGFGVYELLGFDLADVRASYRRAKLDYDRMATMIGVRNRATANYALAQASD